MTTLTYDFNDDTFEYDVDLSDWKNSLSFDVKRDIVDYYMFHTSDYQEVLKEYDESEWDLEDKEFVNDMFQEIENSDLIDDFEDEIKSYFYSDAKEAYDESEAYRKDPYGYNGVRQSDFL